MTAMRIADSCVEIDLSYFVGSVAAAIALSLSLSASPWSCLKEVVPNRSAAMQIFCQVPSSKEKLGCQAWQSLVAFSFFWGGGGPSFEQFSN